MPAGAFRAENRAGQTLDGINRSGALIEDGVFHRARLRSARLARSQWVRCDLAHADLSGADLRLADLSHSVVLRGARLRGARLAGADLSGVDFAGADLTDADLTHARLTGARLSGAKLDRADLRGARGLTIDANSVSGAKLSYDLANQWTPLGQRLAMLAGTFLGFRWLRALTTRLLYGRIPRDCRPPHRTLELRHGASFVRSLLSPADLWLALKRTYTGPWLFLNLLALVAFFLPRLEVGIARISLEQLHLASHTGQAHEAIVREASALRTQLEGELAREPQLRAELQRRGLGERLDRLLGSERVSTARRIPLWWVLLGLHKGWLEAVQSLLLLAYVLMRTVLTMAVGQLAHIELDNGVTPGLDHYRRLIWAHLITRALMCVALAVFARDCYRLLQLEVTILDG